MLLRCAVFQAATDRTGTGRINRGASFFDVSDLAFLIDHERGAVGDSGLGHVHAVEFGELVIVIAGEGIFGL